MLVVIKITEKILIRIGEHLENIHMIQLIQHKTQTSITYKSHNVMQIQGHLNNVFMRRIPQQATGLEPKTFNRYW